MELSLSDSVLGLGSFFKFLIYLLAVLGLSCCVGFSLVAARRLLTAVASLAAKHSRAPRL